MKCSSSLMIRFSPTSSGLMDVLIDVALLGAALPYSEGFVSLVNVTLDEPLWFHHWGYQGDPDIQGAGADRAEPYLAYDMKERIRFSYMDGKYGWGDYGQVSQATNLSEDHEYRLVMYSECNANGDTERVFLDVSGLEIIPEPATLSLLTLGSLALMMVRRRR